VRFSQRTLRTRVEETDRTDAPEETTTTTAATTTETVSVVTSEEMQRRAISNVNAEES
jgi:hypothetical protein